MSENPQSGLADLLKRWLEEDPEGYDEAYEEFIELREPPLDPPADRE